MSGWRVVFGTVLRGDHQRGDHAQRCDLCFDFFLLGSRCRSSKRRAGIRAATQQAVCDASEGATSEAGRGGGNHPAVQLRRQEASRPSGRQGNTPCRAGPGTTRGVRSRRRSFPNPLGAGMAQVASKPPSKKQPPAREAAREAASKAGGAASNQPASQPASKPPAGQPACNAIRQAARGEVPHVAREACADPLQTLSGRGRPKRQASPQATISRQPARQAGREPGSKAASQAGQQPASQAPRMRWG